MRACTCAASFCGCVCAHTRTHVARTVRRKTLCGERAHLCQQCAWHSGGTAGPPATLTPQCFGEMTPRAATPRADPHSPSSLLAALLLLLRPPPRALRGAAPLTEGSNPSLRSPRGSRPCGPRPSSSSPCHGSPCTLCWRGGSGRLRGARRRRRRPVGTARARASFPCTATCGCRACANSEFPQPSLAPRYFVFPKDFLAF